MEKEETIKEIKVKQEGNFFIAMVVLVLLVAIAIVSTLGFDIAGLQLVFFILLLIAFYIIVLSFLLEPKLIREIIRIFTKEVEKPVHVVKEVNKPIQIVRTIVKDNKEKKFNFVGSTETKTYHTKDCRLGKLIKKKYKLEDDEEKHFKRFKFKGCKICIKKVKKV